MNIPVYRAKKIGSNEYIEGYFLPLFITADGDLWDDEDDYNYLINKSFLDKDTYYWTRDKIDPQTLQISFDNGKSWLNVFDLQVHTSTDFNIEYTDMKMRTKNIKQSSNGNIFTIITDKGR